ncbi:hypothetical protein TYRP_016539 [Tyrophagus putrescentiae]|nr:hypothetical protein TYRP_016539 [Tyrophagus putrescentiae]
MGAICLHHPRRRRLLLFSCKPSQWSLPPLEIDEHLSSQCSSFVIGSDWQQCMTGHLALAPVTVLIGAPTALSSGLAPAIVHSDHTRARIRVYCRRGATEENANEEMSARLGRHWIDDNGNGGNGL